VEDKEKGGKLYSHLRHQHKKYLKRYESPPRTGPIKNRIFTDDRPQIAAEKSKLGDWEIDTTIGKDRKQTIITLVERVSKKTPCKKVPSRKATLAKDAIISILTSVRRKYCKKGGGIIRFP